MKPLSHSDLMALVRPHDPPCITIQVAVDGREGAGPAAVKLSNAARSQRAQLDAWAGEDAGRGGAADAAARALDDMVSRLSESPWEVKDVAWMAPTRGLALFASPHFSAVHRLDLPAPDVAACNTSFVVRALLEQHAGDMRFHLLTIHRDDVRLYEGSRAQLAEQPLGDIPRSMEHALGRSFDDSQHGRGFHGAPAPGKGRGNPAAQGVHVHGFAGSDRDDEKDTVRFISRIGHALPRGLGDAGSPPLVVLTLEKKLGLFKKQHPNVQLAGGGVAADPKLLTPEDLHARAWQALAPLREKRVLDACEAVEAGLARGRSSKDVVDIAKAAVIGRVGTLLVAAGKTEPGTLDEATGAVVLDGPAGRSQDVLDQIAGTVLLHRGDVVFAPADAMHSKVAAVYRY